MPGEPPVTAGIPQVSISARLKFQLPAETPQNRPVMPHQAGNVVTSALPKQTLPVDQLPRGLNISLHAGFGSSQSWPLEKRTQPPALRAKDHANDRPGEGRLSPAGSLKRRLGQPSPGAPTVPRGVGMCAGVSRGVANLGAGGAFAFNALRPTEPKAEPEAEPKAAAGLSPTSFEEGFFWAVLECGADPVRIAKAPSLASLRGHAAGGQGEGGGTTSPEAFLTCLLESRGLSATRTKALEADPTQGWRVKPTPKMIADYDMAFVKAVRDANLSLIDAAAAEGRTMDACNSYGESIMHMACRRGNCAMLQHLLRLGASMKVVDDFGRTPLHDACWTPEPCLDVVNILCQTNPAMLLLLDRRGASPLDYVRPDHRDVWCALLWHMRDEWFPAPAAASNKASGPDRPRRSAAEATGGDSPVAGASMMSHPTSSPGAAPGAGVALAGESGGGVNGGEAPSATQREKRPRKGERDRAAL